MRIRFLDVAQRELDDAVAWYTEQEEGLGLDFLDELDRTIRRIKTFPLASTEIESEIRRCLLARFPYGVIYGIDGDSIIIVAVAHLHRHPDIGLTAYRASNAIIRLSPALSGGAGNRSDSGNFDSDAAFC